MKTKIIIGALIGVIAAAVVACVIIFVPFGDDGSQSSSGYTSEYPSDSSGGQSADSSGSGFSSSNGSFSSDIDGGGSQGLMQFKGLSFESNTFVYDGTEKSLAIAGDLPDGAKVR